MTTEEILEQIRENYEECLTADGFDEAIIGIAESCGRKTVVCYDYDRCVDILVSAGDTTPEEAREFLDFNTGGAYVGEYTPLFLHNWRADEPARTEVHSTEL